MYNVLLHSINIYDKIPIQVSPYLRARNKVLLHLILFRPTFFRVTNCVEMEKSAVMRNANESSSVRGLESGGSEDSTCSNGTSTSAKQTVAPMGTVPRGSDVVKVYVNFAAE